MLGENAQDTPRVMPARGQGGEARESNHGVATPVAKTMVASNDGILVRRTELPKAGLWWARSEASLLPKLRQLLFVVSKIRSMAPSVNNRELVRKRSTLLFLNCVGSRHAD